MMTINNVSMNSSFSNVTSKPAPASSSESKALQTQLINKQQSLSKLSSDKNMTTQDKEKERQKIQREIAELNRKLKQEQMEEEEKAKETAKEQEDKLVAQKELLAKTNFRNNKESQNPSEEALSLNPNNKDKKDFEIPSMNMQNILTVSSIKKQNTIQNSAEKKQINQQNILESEIKSDALYGMDTTSKKEQLSKMRRKPNVEIEILPYQPEQITKELNTTPKIIIRE